MSEIIRITAPVLGVNDSTVVVYEYLAENYGSVSAGQEILSVETSKTVTALTAPSDGIIRYTAGIGEEVPTGALLAVIGPSREAVDDYLGAQSKAASTDTTSIGSGDNAPAPAVISAPGTAESTAFGMFAYPVTLGEIFRRGGETAEQGEALCRIRTPHGTETLTAPATGVVRWEKLPYETVKAGERIGTISRPGCGAPAAKASEVPYRRTDTVYGTVRLSAQAKELLERNNTTAEALGLSGLIRGADVLNALSPGAKNTVPARDTPKQPDSGAGDGYIQPVKGHIETQSKAKRAEVSYLSAANSGAVVSRVSALVPTRGIITACSEDEQLAGRFSSIIIMEVSKLLRRYPRLCSAYSGNGVFVYDEINVGYAVSAGFGLAVPVLRNCDRLSLDEIISRKSEFIGKYLDRKLTEEDLSGGTFTVTDLSSSGCYMFEPVLNLGQSAILGIGGENTMRTDYPLVLAFDHRVSDGAEAAAFLGDLRNRLIAHENALLGVSPDDSAEKSKKDACCEICYRDAEELEKKGRHLFKTVDSDGSERYICSVCAEGW